jgi:thiosulfate/3-mercaptopyruvate sulfurtransferase
MLVNTATLAGHLNDPRWVIFDCRHDLMDYAKGERLYREGHIPGAHFASMETALSGPKTGTNGRHPLPSPESFASFLASRGVFSRSTVVAYDDVGGLYAARLWWMARWMGIRSVSLLDGGISKWVAEDRGITRSIPSPHPTELHAQADPTMIQDAGTVLRHLSDPAHAIIDSRPAERFRGEVEPIDPVAGHIPGALNRFYKANLNADLTFRPPAELKREFLTLIQPRAPENIVNQCGSGVTACASIFAMEYAGLPGSKLYPGSWSEWIADPTRPVFLGPANQKAAK